ncbi:MAG: twin-arginine translocase TatA/TatE family subunit [bacterium]|nr:twin-arginine translocase TatA/TatE family subunit [bacterium]
MLAIFNFLNFTEMGIVLVGAIMVFGKDLPKVVMRGLQQLSKLRRTVTEMWREAGLEQEFKRVKAELEPEIAEFASAKKAVQDGKSLMDGPVAHWRKSIGIDVEDVIEVGGSTVDNTPESVDPETTSDQTTSTQDQDDSDTGDELVGDKEAAPIKDQMD